MTEASDTSGKMCCSTCVAEPHLKAIVVSLCQTGDCSYCAGHDVPVIAVKDLGAHLRLCLRKAYEQVETAAGTWLPDAHCYVEGKAAADILRDDEPFASEALRESGKDDDLICDALDESAPDHRAIAGGESDDLADELIMMDPVREEEDNPYAVKWVRFCYYVRYDRRYTFSNFSDSEHEHLLQMLEWVDPLLREISEGRTFFRVRVAEEPLSSNPNRRLMQIGPPPADRAQNNRMSPRGISYFYVSEDEATAILETEGSSTADRIWLGKFKARKSLRVLNLGGVGALAGRSIFDPDYEHAERCRFGNFWEGFRNDVSQPFKTDDKDLGYIPTQIVAELLRNRGFDGVCYRSAKKRNGSNLVFFCTAESDAKANDCGSGSHSDECRRAVLPAMPSVSEWFDLIDVQEKCRAHTWVAADV